MAFLREHPGQHITKHHVEKLASSAYLKAMTPTNLVSAFQKTGIYPLKKDCIPPEKVMPSVVYMETTGAEKQESTSAACGFLEQKKIIHVDASKQTKKRTQQSVVGHLSSVKNMDILTA